MATAESVKAKLQNLIATANEATGNEDENLTDAVNTLIAGYGQGGGAAGLEYDMGEFVLDADSNRATVQHALGVTPDFIVVWSDDFADREIPTDASDFVGCVFLRGLSGLQQRFTSSGSTEYGIYAAIIRAKGDTYNRAQVVIPVSTSYLPKKGYNLGDSSFEISGSSSTVLLRSGVTYKYFASRAWWNISEGSAAE